MQDPQKSLAQNRPMSTLSSAVLLGTREDANTLSRCRSCGLLMAAARHHGTDADCVQALRSEIHSLQASRTRKLATVTARAFESAA